MTFGINPKQWAKAARTPTSPPAIPRYQGTGTFVTKDGKKADYDLLEQNGKIHMVPKYQTFIGTGPYQPWHTFGSLEQAVSWANKHQIGPKPPSAPALPSADSNRPTGVEKVAGVQRLTSNTASSSSWKAVDNTNLHPAGLGAPVGTALRTMGLTALEAAAVTLPIAGALAFGQEFYVKGYYSQLDNEVNKIHGLDRQAVEAELLKKTPKADPLWSEANRRQAIHDFVSSANDSQLLKAMFNPNIFDEHGRVDLSNAEGPAYHLPNGDIITSFSRIVKEGRIADAAWGRGGKPTNLADIPRGTPLFQGTDVKSYARAPDGTLVAILPNGYGLASVYGKVGELRLVKPDEVKQQLASAPYRTPDQLAQDTQLYWTKSPAFTAPSKARASTGPVLWNPPQPTPGERSVFTEGFGKVIHQPTSGRIIEDGTFLDKANRQIVSFDLLKKGKNYYVVPPGGQPTATYWPGAKPTPTYWHKFSSAQEANSWLKNHGSFARVVVPQSTSAGQSVTHLGATPTGADGSRTAGDVHGDRPLSSATGHASRTGQASLTVSHKKAAGTGSGSATGRSAAPATNTLELSPNMPSSESARPSDDRPVGVEQKHNAANRTLASVANAEQITDHTSDQNQPTRTWSAKLEVDEAQQLAAQAGLSFSDGTTVLAAGPGANGRQIMQLSNGYYVSFDPNKPEEIARYAGFWGDGHGGGISPLSGFGNSPSSDNLSTTSQQYTDTTKAVPTGPSGDDLKLETVSTPTITPTPPPPPPTTGGNPAPLKPVGDVENGFGVWVDPTGTHKAL